MYKLLCISRAPSQIVGWLGYAGRVDGLCPGLLVAEKGLYPLEFFSFDRKILKIEFFS